MLLNPNCLNYVGSKKGFTREVGILVFKSLVEDVLCLTYRALSTGKLESRSNDLCLSLGRILVLSCIVLALTVPLSNQ